MQWEMSLIHHEVRDSVIDQRAIDGYVNATAMCRVAGKLFADYTRLRTTKDFPKALHVDMGIPISELIQQVRGGHPELQGTWVHPQVAIHLAQWLSPEFAIKVSQWVFEWFSGGGPRQSKLPDHVRRYLVNRRKIPHTHFSMLNQMILHLLAPLEDRGYILPDRMVPDIALRRMFSRWCRENGYDPEKFPTYPHECVDGRRPVVDSRLYPNELMTAFNLELERWIRDGRALQYFRKKDGDAILPIQVAVLRHLAESGDDMAAIFEDDARMHPDLPDVLDALSGKAHKFDIIKLQRRYTHCPYFPVYQLLPSYRLGRVRYSDFGADGYVITRHAAAHLLQRFPHPVHEIDWITPRFWENGLRNVLYVNPPVVFHDGMLPSYIDKQSGVTRAILNAQIRRDPRIAVRRVVAGLKRRHRRWSKFRELRREDRAIDPHGF